LKIVTAVESECFILSEFSHQRCRTIEYTMGYGWKNERPIMEM
jgi:hypothetical protein